jgi:hypothetical protein
LEPREFSAHGLRSGYLTEAARQGVALPEAMQQSNTGRCNRRPGTTMRQSGPWDEPRA